MITDSRRIIELKYPDNRFITTRQIELRHEKINLAIAEKAEPISLRLQHDEPFQPNRTYAYCVMFLFFLLDFSCSVGVNKASEKC